MQAPKQKLLWITPKWPFPVADGARIASTQLLKNLTQKGMEIHLVSIVPEEETVHFADAEKELGIKEVTLVRRKSLSRFQQLLGFFKTPFTPITLAPYTTSSVRKHIEQVAQDESVHLIVYDGLHTAGWKFSFGKGKKIRCSEAYRAHNVESDIWFRAAKETKNLFKKAMLHFQGRLIRNFETKLTRESEYVFPVSITDQAKFQTYLPKGKLHTLPIGIQVHAPTSSAHTIPIQSKRKILFVGKLDWAPNRDGLKWVLDEVWPKARERASDLSLTIVGSGDGAWLEPYQNLAGVHIIGQVPSVAPYYEDCLATIVPVFYGSGTRVKAIESSLYGRVCISTQIGVEGMGLIEGESYARAEQAEDWIHALVFLESPQAIQMGRRARDYARQAFDPGLIAERFIQSISGNITHA